MKKIVQFILCLLFLACGSNNETSSSEPENLNPTLNSNRTSLSFEDTMVSLKSESKLITLSSSNLNSDILILVCICIGLCLIQRLTVSLLVRDSFDTYGHL